MIPFFSSVFSLLAAPNIACRHPNTSSNPLSLLPETRRMPKFQPFSSKQQTTRTTRKICKIRFDDDDNDDDFKSKFIGFHLHHHHHFEIFMMVCAASEMRQKYRMNFVNFVHDAQITSRHRIPSKLNTDFHPPT